MTGPETIADRLNTVAERAAADIRNPELRRVFRDLLGIVGEIAATRPEPATGMTRDELERALGGAQFLSTLARLLREIDAARAADVERVVAHVLAAARQPGP